MHADLLPVNNMACQLDKDFHLGLSVTWMGEMFPSIASSAPHKLVMVAIHQSWLQFVFLSIVRLANILQLVVCADISLKILTKQIYMGDLIFLRLVEMSAPIFWLLHLL